ncbi:MAG: hypothetical protein ACR2IE_00190 [Candidatus Sumerlaeaceae bacterium]
MDTSSFTVEADHTPVPPRSPLRPRLFEWISGTFAEAIIAFLLFAAIAVFQTWPLCADFRNQIPGDNGDAFALLWNFWYVPYGLTQPGVSLWFTEMQLAPYGAHLIFHTNCYLLALVAWPVNAALGIAAAYNASVLLSMSLTGLGFYLLCRDAKTSRAAGFLAGYAFAFSPFVFAHLPGHLTLIQTQFIPFALLFLRRTAFAGPFDWLNAGALGVCVWAAAVTDLTIFVTTLLLCCVCLLSLMVERGIKLRWQPLLINLLLAAGVSVVLALPWIRAYVVARSGHDYSTKPWAGSETFCGPRDFFVPPVFHGLWGKALNPTAGVFPWQYSEAGAYLGWACILLAVIGAVMRRSRPVWPWVIAVAVFVNLSVGNRYSAPAQTHWKWIMLGRYLPDLPLLDQVRVPARFALGAHACIAYLVAVGCDALQSTRTRWSRFVPVMIAPLLVLDFWFAPSPVLKVSPVPSYCDFLAKQQGTVLLFPVGIGSGVGYNGGMLQTQQLIDQRVHHKPLLCAYVSRIPQDVVEKISNDLMFNTLLALQKDKAVDTLPDSTQVVDFCTRAKIAWIVLPPEYGPGTRLYEFLKSTLGLGEPRRFPEADVYAVKRIPGGEQPGTGSGR